MWWTSPLIALNRSCCMQRRDASLDLLLSILSVYHSPGYLKKNSNHSITMTITDWVLLPSTVPPYFNHNQLRDQEAMCCFFAEFRALQPYCSRTCKAQRLQCIIEAAGFFGRSFRIVWQTRANHGKPTKYTQDDTSLVMCKVDFTTNSCGFLVEVKQGSHIQSNCLTKALTPQREPKQILHRRNIQIHLKSFPMCFDSSVQQGATSFNPAQNFVRFGSAEGKCFRSKAARLSWGAAVLSVVRSVLQTFRMWWA